MIQCIIIKLIMKHSRGKYETFLNYALKKKRNYDFQTYEPLAYMYNPNASIRSKETVYKHVS